MSDCLTSYGVFDMSVYQGLLGVGQIRPVWSTLDTRFIIRHLFYARNFQFWDLSYNRLYLILSVRP